METIIRELVVKYGAPFIDKFDDFTDESDKELLFEKITNSVDWTIPLEAIANTVVDEMVVYMTYFVEKGKYDLEVIEEAFTYMVELACFNNFNSNIDKEALMKRIDFEDVFNELS
ncbi:hypothetical protein [Enterococcus mundtii]|uniref:hypothetical protein n=1 Tax=Enterococcus mundtii TaxID=53346 RepID=UPI001A965045|nr:hypothetical protein [Enterococcus mundtii]MBO1087175.1 hypothetical protein [Enterococcus mundtii]